MYLVEELRGQENKQPGGLKPQRKPTTRSHSEADCYQIVSCRVSYPIPRFHVLIDITLFGKDCYTVAELSIPIILCFPI